MGMPLPMMPPQGGAMPPRPGTPMPVGAPPGGANPLAALAQRGQGGMPDQAMQFLIFLAGQGFDKFVSAMQKLKGKPDGMKKDAAGAPGQAVPPQMAAMLAARARMGGMAPGMPPGMPPVSNVPPTSGTPF